MSSSQTQNEDHQTKRVYDIEYLLEFRNLPHCIEPPENAVFPKVLLHERRERKKSFLQKRTEQRENDKKSKSFVDDDDDEEEEILFKPSKSNTTNEDTNDGSKEPSKKQQYYPGRKKLARCGVDTSGMSNAELFELERQQARAKFSAKKDDGNKTDTIPSSPKESPVCISEPNEDSLKPFVEGEFSTLFSKVDPFSEQSSSSLSFNLNDTKPKDVNSSPLMSLLSSSVPERDTVQFSSSFDSSIEFQSSKFNVSDIESRMNKGTPPLSDDPLSIISPNSRGASILANLVKSESELDSSSLLSHDEFSLPEPRAPVHTIHNQMPGPLPVNEKIAAANQIGNNLLAMLEQGMRRNNNMKQQQQHPGQMNPNSNSQDNTNFGSFPPPGMQHQNYHQGNFRGGPMYPPQRGMHPNQMFPNGNYMPPQQHFSSGNQNNYPNPMNRGGIPSNGMMNYHPSDMQPHHAQQNHQPQFQPQFSNSRNTNYNQPPRYPPQSMPSGGNFLFNRREQQQQSTNIPIPQNVQVISLRDLENR